MKEEKVLVIPIIPIPIVVPPPVKVVPVAAVAVIPPVSLINFTLNDVIENRYFFKYHFYYTKMK